MHFFFCDFNSFVSWIFFCCCLNFVFFSLRLCVELALNRFKTETKRFEKKNLKTKKRKQKRNSIKKKKIELNKIRHNWKDNKNWNYDPKEGEEKKKDTTLFNIHINVIAISTAIIVSVIGTLTNFDKQIEFGTENARNIFFLYFGFRFLIALIYKQLLVCQMIALMRFDVIRLISR